MVEKSVEIHMINIRSEIEWLIRVINGQFRSYFEDGQQDFTINDFPPPPLDEGSYYSDLVKENDLKPEERLVLILSIIPHVQPQILDIFFTKVLLRN